MKAKKLVISLIMLAIIMSVGLYSNISNADTQSWTESNVVETHTCTVNGVERVIITLKNGEIHFKIGNEDSILLTADVFDIKFDKYGTVWALYKNDDIAWFNYDLIGTDPILFYLIPKENSTEYFEDVESLVLDENNEFVVGYKTFSGETYPILTPDEMKAYLGISDNVDPTITPSATPEQPEIPTPSPDLKPSPSPSTSSEKPPASKTDTNTNTKANNKVSLVNKGSYKCLSVGGKVVSKYKLKKGVLTWKGSKKSKKVKPIKRVKQVGFIKKSKNLIYVTKKGKAYTISPKGKKKTIVKKGAKKLIFKGKFVTKVKKKSGYTNVVNK